MVRQSLNSGHVILVINYKQGYSGAAGGGSLVPTASISSLPVNTGGGNSLGTRLGSYKPTVSASYIMVGDSRIRNTVTNTG